MFEIPAVIKCSKCGYELHHDSTSVQLSSDHRIFLQPVTPLVFKAQPCPICLDVARTENPHTKDGKPLFSDSDPGETTS